MNMMHLLHGSDRKVSTRRRPRAFRPSLKPTLEGLEIRTVLSAPSAMAPVQATAINVLPQLNSIVTLAGTTFNVATSLGNQTVNQALTLSTSPNPADPTCPILHLQLGPIHLSLLGLNVDTSNICLNIDAHQGGGLLGNLLCGLSNALNADTLHPGALSTFLSGLSPSDLSTLTSGLGSLINGALGTVTTTAAPGSAPGASTPAVLGTTPGACDILHLSLGPVDLNLLGLEVQLNNCATPPGPVTVDITAVPSGGLLGQLLCSLDDLLTNGHASNRAINQLLTNAAKDINTLV